MMLTLDYVVNLLADLQLSCLCLTSTPQLICLFSNYYTAAASIVCVCKPSNTANTEIVSD
jgi:hypothetical protein